MKTLVIIAVVAIAIAIVMRRRQNKPGSGTSSGNGYVSLPIATFPLRPYSQAGEYSAEKGSYGQQIANLQRICSEKFAYKIQVDGMWGDKTTAAFHKCLGTLLFSDNISEAQYNIFMNQHGK